jgi:hypothetical protein
MTRGTLFRIPVTAAAFLLCVNSARRETRFMQSTFYLFMLERQAARGQANITGPRQFHEMDDQYLRSER